MAGGVAEGAENYGNSLMIRGARGHLKNFYNVKVPLKCPQETPNINKKQHEYVYGFLVPSYLYSSLLLRLRLKQRSSLV